MLTKTLVHKVLIVFALATWLSPTAHGQSQKRWYLAEGATGAFEDFVLIGNPTASDATVRITFLRPNGTTIVHEITVGRSSRATVKVNDVAGLSNELVSAVVESSVDLVVERSMYFLNGSKTGGHSAPAVAAPAETWIFAEGATGVFEEFILIANPGPLPANVTATYLKEDGTTVVQSLTVAGNGRSTIAVNAVPGLANATFSAVVKSTNGVGVIAERAMYFGGFKAGHDSVGVTAPALTWRFAEGFTGTAFAQALSFDTYLLLANPNDTPATVKVTYFREAGAPVEKTYTVGAKSRVTVATDAIPGLESAGFSMVAESQNGVTFVAERSVYFGSGGTWTEGHNTVGATDPATTWGFAEGVEDGGHNTVLANAFFDSFFLVNNASPGALNLQATFVREDGTGIVRAFVVPAQSRFTIAPGNFAELAHQRYATFLTSTNAVQFTAERAVYWSSSPGGVWHGGHASIGTPLTAAASAPTGAPAPATVNALSPASGSSDGGTVVTITGNNFGSNASVIVGGAEATNVLVVNAATITARTRPRAAGTFDVIVTTNGQTRTLPAGFTYVASAPPPPSPPSPPPPPATTCVSSNPATIVTCERAKFGFMSPSDLFAFLRNVARSLNANGIPGGPFGLLRKVGGTNCNGYSCDILCAGQGDGQRQYDTLSDAEGAQIPKWEGPLSPIRVDVCEIQ